MYLQTNRFLENILNEQEDVEQELGRGARSKNKKLRRKILTDESDEDILSETDITEKPSQGSFTIKMT